MKFKQRVGAGVGAMAMAVSSVVAVPAVAEARPRDIDACEKAQENYGTYWIGMVFAANAYEWQMFKNSFIRATSEMTRSCGYDPNFPLPPIP